MTRARGAGGFARAARVVVAAASRRSSEPSSSPILLGARAPRLDAVVVEERVHRVESAVHATIAGDRVVLDRRVEETRVRRREEVIDVDARTGRPTLRVTFLAYALDGAEAAVSGRTYVIAEDEEGFTWSREDGADLTGAEEALLDTEDWCEEERNPWIGAFPARPLPIGDVVPELAARYRAWLRRAGADVEVTLEEVRGEVRATDERDARLAVLSTRVRVPTSSIAPLDRVATLLGTWTLHAADGRLASVAYEARVAGAVRTDAAHGELRSVVTGSRTRVASRAD